MLTHYQRIEVYRIFQKQTNTKHVKEILYTIITVLSIMLLLSMSLNVWNCHKLRARNVNSGEQDTEVPKNRILIAIPGQIPHSGEETDESDRDSGVVDVTDEAGNGDVASNSDDTNVVPNVNSAGNGSGNNAGNNGDNGSQRSTTRNTNQEGQEATSAPVLLPYGIDKEESEPLLVANDEPPNCIPFVTQGVTVNETKI